MFNSIPNELKQYPQWVCWTEDKIPINPHTGQYASVTKSETWGTFDEAVNCFKRGRTLDSWTKTELKLCGIGFVFTADDPFVGIDIDSYKDATPEELQLCQDVLENIVSYTEHSPSGKGLHIICKANIAESIKTPTLEMYFTGRYFTVTGNHVASSPSDILSCQDNVNVLFNGLVASRNSKAKTYIIHTEEQLTKLSKEEISSDADILKQARSAKNGQLFSALWNAKARQRNSKDGDLQVPFEAPVDEAFAYMYPSQSEADQALYNILWFHSKNDEQTDRLFLASGLGKRAKAQRADYRRRTLKKAKDQTLDITNVNTDRSADNNTLAADAVSLSELDYAYITNPDIGPMAQLISHFYSRLRRPILEHAIVPAISGVGTLVSRKYYVGDNMGLNQYILAIAESGVGKDDITDDISSIIQNSVGVIPGKIRSGESIRDLIAQHVTYIHIWDEVAGLHEQLLSNNNDVARGIADEMLRLYSASKVNGKYAVHTTAKEVRNKENRTILSPCFNLFGTAVPKRFWLTMNDKAFDSGLIPRLLIFEGVRKPVRREMPDRTGPLPSNIDEILTTLRINAALDVKIALGGEEPFKFGDTSAKRIQVTCALEATTLYKGLYLLYADKADATINTYMRVLYTRSFIKIVKLAALCAILQDTVNPQITLAQLEWAKYLVDYSDSLLESKVEADVPIGAEHIERKNKVLTVMRDFLLCKKSHTNYNDEKLAALRKLRLIPYSVIVAHTREKGLWSINGVPKYKSLLDETLAQLEQEGLILIYKKGHNDDRFKKLINGEVYEATDQFPMKE